MNKTQFYLSQCAEAASKSPMCFTLGAVMVKGGKVISSGHNHHRPHYDGAEVHKQGHRKVSFSLSPFPLAKIDVYIIITQPVSMHAEMHVIFNLTGMSPSFKTQVQGNERRVPQGTRVQHAPPGRQPKGKQTKGCAGSEWRLSELCGSAASSSSSLLLEEQEQPSPVDAESQPNACFWT